MIGFKGKGPNGDNGNGMTGPIPPYTPEGPNCYTKMSFTGTYKCKLPPDPPAVTERSPALPKPQKAVAVIKGKITCECFCSYVKLEHAVGEDLSIGANCGSDGERFINFWKIKYLDKCADETGNIDLKTCNKKKPPEDFGFEQPLYNEGDNVLEGEVPPAIAESIAAALDDCKIKYDRKYNTGMQHYLHMTVVQWGPPPTTTFFNSGPLTAAQAACLNKKICSCDSGEFNINLAQHTLKPAIKKANDACEKLFSKCKQPVSSV